MGFSESQAQCYRIDSLRRVLNFISIYDTTRVDALNLLSHEFYEDRQFRNAEYFVRQSLLLAERMKYLLGQGDANLILGDILFQNPISHSESIESYKKALEIYQSVDSPEKEAHALRQIAEYYYSLFYQKEEYYQFSLEHYLQYAHLSDSLGQTVNTAEAFVSIGNIYDQLGEENQSRQYYLKAVDLKKDIEDQEVENPHLFTKAERYYKLQIEYQKLYNYILIGGLLFLLLLLGMLMTYYLITIRSNRILKKQKKEIEKQKNSIQEKNQELEEQSQQIRAQRDTLAEQNKQIQETQEEIRIANDNLTQMNTHLEELVRDRTRDLYDTNQALISVNEELDTLIYRASHDFKGPLATLTGLSQIARMEVQSHPQSLMFLDKIDHTTRQMDSMLDKLHQISYIMGKEPSNQLVQLSDIVEQVKINLEPAIQQKEAKVLFESEDAPRFFSDQEFLTYILENLVENAIQFHGAGGEPKPAVEIRVKETIRGVELEVRDNGAGISAEHFPKLFDMFYRASEDSDGNGLGLYLVRKALDKLGGEVEVSSILEQGSVFRVKLPS